jgi:peptide/nickel transport system substrate-binding protein
MLSEKAPRAAAVVTGMALVALGLTSCGGMGPTGSQGGALTFDARSFPDHLDPQLSSTVLAWQAEYNTYIPLLTFRHAAGQEGSQVAPGLAKDLPTISEDGRTYTLQLQPGLRYSDGTPVRASDFQTTMQRLFDLGSSGARLFEGIVGADDYAHGQASSISGIETSDSTGVITIRLRAPDGELETKLASPFAALVPPNTPAKDQTANPPPATGPYEISASSPPHRFVLERNPAWAAGNEGLIPNVPTPHADKITQTVVGNPSVATTQVERNRADFMIATPPPDRLVELNWKYPDRFRTDVAPSTYYFWMNTTQPPFDELKVRQAVDYAVDPAALQRIYDSLMSATQQVLPPGVPGYLKFSPYPHDFATARQLIQEASPSDRRVTVWTDDLKSDKRAGAYLESVLRRLGFATKLRVVSAAAYYETVGNPSTPNLDAGFASWAPLLPHPNQYFGTLLHGRAIRAVDNPNLAQLDDPALNDEIERLAKQPLDASTNAEYSALDRSVMAKAPWAPWGNREVSTFTSDRVDFDSVIFNPVMRQDYGSFALK